MSENKPEADAIAAMSAAHQEVRSINGTPALIVPSGYKVETLARLLGAPTRKAGTTTLLDAASFIAVVNDQKGEDTRLFSTLNPPTFTAVFNATAAGPGWGDHRAHYALPLSAEWKIWEQQDEQKVSQVAMAQFLENNLEDVLSPAGAELLEVCRTLEAKKSVEFASSVRLSNGENQLVFKEEINGSAGNGTLNIPEVFKIGIPVFENGDRWPIDVRLRYRITGSKLEMWIEMVRAHKILETAVKEARATIGTETSLPVLNGSAPTNRGD